MNADKYVDFHEKANSLIEIMKSNDMEIINKAKLDCLWEASNFLELVVNYIVLHRYGIQIDFGSSIIKKGTKLYRIRAFQEGTDFSKPEEWLPPPRKPQNRANKDGEDALYLGSKETVCYLETHMTASELYVLGRYECQEDIVAGGFPLFDEKNSLFTYAAIILNAFLIAPSRCDKNKELFSFLDLYFEHITLDDLSNMKLVTNAIEEMKLPYKFAVLNQRDKLYNLTNQLCDAIKELYPEGIRYSSCYIPMETSAIVCSDFNLVLYSSGISKVRFVDYEIKSFSQSRGHIEFNSTNVAKIFLKGIKDEEIR